MKQRLAVAALRPFGVRSAFTLERRQIQYPGDRYHDPQRGRCGYSAGQRRGLPVSTRRDLTPGSAPTRNASAARAVIGLLAAAIAAVCADPAWAYDRIDVTKAVREAGDLCTLDSNCAARDGYPLTNLVDGNVASGNKYFSNWEGHGPVYQAHEKGEPVWISYAIAATFEAGKDIVVDGYEISVSQSEGNALNRLPYAWRFEGSNDGQDWTVLDENGGFANWGTPTVDGQPQYCTHFHIHNSTAFRHYRLTITKQYWEYLGLDPDGGNVGAIQLGELRLFGYVGDDLDGKVDEGLVDLTESVRRIGDSMSKVSANTAAYGDLADYAVENAFDGGPSRFFSAYDNVKNAYASGGVTIEYEFGDLYAHGADVVVTGYSIMAGSGFNWAFCRMPCDWQFQGYDEATSTWRTLDEYAGFKLWDGKMQWNETDQIGFDFAFANSSAYRRYRLLITRQVWATLSGFDPVANNQGAMQISEIRLFGHVGKGIAGQVRSAPGVYPLKLVEWASYVHTGNYTAMTPAISTSAFTTLGDVAERLFNGLAYDRSFYWLNDAEGHTNEIPFSIVYALPEGAMAGRQVNVTNYVLEVNKAWDGWNCGIPLNWRLEGKSGDTWVVMDRRTNFTGWQEAPISYVENGVTQASVACRGSFAIAEKRQFAATAFRLRIDAFAGKYGDRARDLFMLSEITFEGAWGLGVVRAKPLKYGVRMSVR
ncbi:MAG: discoidin domain-containing protein [Kiritimatiellia bacterium]